MTYVLRYSSTRSEVWRAYWRLWRSRLWRIHVAAALVFAFLMSWLMPELADPAGWAASSSIGFGVVVLFSATYPQMVFKKSERTLTVTAEGWSTQIGSKSGARKWNEVTAVREQSGAIFIGSKSGALIIPRRAFASDAERNRFLSDVKDWQQSKNR